MLLQVLHNNGKIYYIVFKISLKQNKNSLFIIIFNIHIYLLYKYRIIFIILLLFVRNKK